MHRTRPPSVQPECECCGVPATHQAPNEPLCEQCARSRCAHTRGEAAAALEILSAVIHTLDLAGLSWEEIRAAARHAYEYPSFEDASVDIPEWMVGGFEDDTRYRPLEEATS